MAQRKRDWRFYVYEVLAGERVVYVGKGSGRRMWISAKERGGDPVEVARFRREQDAYSHERERISWYQGLLNKCRGGNGSKAARQRAPRIGSFPDVERVGTRAYAAMVLARYYAATYKLLEKRLIESNG